MKDVSIVYCKPCGYLKQAEAAAAAIKKELGYRVSLEAGRGGIFEVRVGDRVVAKRVRGHFPDAAEIVRSLVGVAKAT